MGRAKTIVGVLVAALLGLLGPSAGGEEATSQPATTQGGVVIAAGDLTMEAFESGEMKLAEATPEQLETFIQKLNRLKDADYLAHRGKPGPASARLWKWISQATDHLKSQGYEVNEEGNLVRPDGTVIPCR